MRCLRLVLSLRVWRLRSSSTAAFCRVTLSSVLLSERAWRSAMRATLALNSVIPSWIEETWVVGWVSRGGSGQLREGASVGVRTSAWNSAMGSNVPLPFPEPLVAGGGAWLGVASPAISTA